MKNAMQLKAYIKKIATAKKIWAQLVLQNYMLERLLERISLSKYKDNFILKGGFLLAAMVGLDTRATCPSLLHQSGVRYSVLFHNGDIRCSCIQSVRSGQSNTFSSLRSRIRSHRT